MALRNAKAKGSRNEYRSRRLLEAQGYRVTRAAGSMGEWDLVGIGGERFMLVQVKTRDWPGKREREILGAFPCPGNCHKVIHRWRDGEREPDCLYYVPTVGWT